MECTRIVTNAYFNYRVFSKVKKVKFIITVSRTDMGSDSENFFSTFKYFLKNFKDIQRVKDNIIDATCLLVTKVHDTEAEVEERLQTMLNFKSNVMSSSVLSVFQELL